MTTRHFTSMPQPLILLVSLWCFSTSSLAQTFTGNDDDTILIEKELSQKISYSAAFKSLAKHVFKFDVDAALSGGQNCRDAVIRSFSDFADRTKYRLNVKQDKVEVRFTLNF